MANWFINCGDDSEGGAESRSRLYSFEKDANFVFAGFRATHGLDLQKVELHWWEFVALFMDLGQDTTFCQLTSLRNRVKTGKASKEELRAAADMGEMFLIEEPDTKTLEQKEKDRAFDAQIKKAEKARDERRKAENEKSKS